MSRTTLCTATAGALAVLALGMMLVRYRVLGNEVWRPVGPGTWKVSLVVQGVSHGRARLQAATQLHRAAQPLLDDRYTSAHLSYRAPDSRNPERRRVLWSQRAGAPDGPFKLRADFHVALPAESSAPRTPTGPYAPPRKG